MPTTDHFEFGLIERLAASHPTRDVAWLADEIAGRGSRIRNPSAALVSACLRSEREDTHRAGTRPPTPEQNRPRGGFWPNGDWNPDGSGLSALDSFMGRIVRRRRTTCDPPSTFALLLRQVENERFLPAFRARTLDRWQDCDDAGDWPAMPTQSAAEEHVKRCGRPVGQHRWDVDHGIWWVPVAERSAHGSEQPEPGPCSTGRTNTDGSGEGSETSAAVEAPQEEIAW
jgi:hypothetical protein